MRAHLLTVEGHLRDRAPEGAHDAGRGDESVPPRASDRTGLPRSPTRKSSYESHSWTPNSQPNLRAGCAGATRWSARCSRSRTWRSPSSWPSRSTSSGSTSSTARSARADVAPLAIAAAGRPGCDVSSGSPSADARRRLGPARRRRGRRGRAAGRVRGPGTPARRSAAPPAARLARLRARGASSSYGRVAGARARSALPRADRDRRRRRGGGRDRRASTASTRSSSAAPTWRWRSTASPSPALRACVRRSGAIQSAAEAARRWRRGSPAPTTRPLLHELAAGRSTLLVCGGRRAPVRARRRRRRRAPARRMEAVVPPPEAWHVTRTLRAMELLAVAPALGAGARRRAGRARADGAAGAEAPRVGGLRRA